ncbi:hypothetical protein [Paenibacillus thalictri]|uniref:Uncharacterized protein n=1 Tax=Paenibacillus thalictri TaxID=2527873 RepID=A0A4V2J3H0_9BACL|nr:hypothetical protein [Paenibacillus thalictri]TBL72381.1 hypothetical protein EYB31_28760 [Paenibacillus thalictri]
MKYTEGYIRSIEEYKLEAFVRQYHRKTSSSGLDWKQLVQYAASHTVNQYFSLPVSRRTPEAIAHFVEKYWTNRVNKFQSPEHFRLIKMNVTAKLTRFLGQAKHLTPMVLFESFPTYIEELGLEIAYIVQALSVNAAGINAPYTIHKYAVDVTTDMLLLVQHLTVVCCSKAFASLPQSIVVNCVTSGCSYVCYAKDMDLEKSLDYIRLMVSAMAETDSIQDRSRATGFHPAFLDEVLS